MSGTIIFDDLDGTVMGPLSLGGSTHTGLSFTTPDSTFGPASVLTDVKFLLQDPAAATDTGAVVASLWSDSGDPDSPTPVSFIVNLGTFSDSSLTTTDSVKELVLNSAPQLTPATRYWIKLSDADSSASSVWEYTNDDSGTGVSTEYNETESGSTGVVTSNGTGPQIAQFTVAPACFAAGTRILTAEGEVAVEALQPGAMLAVMREGGFAPMRWLGHRRVDCRRHPRPHDVWPVRVAAGAFGRGRPTRDLVLSPDHAVFVADPALGHAGGLVPIRYLLNGATICQTPVDSVAYYHVELERHDVLLADGLAVESYLDTGNRAAFANAGGAATIAHPDFARRVWSEQSCAPLLTDGPPLATLRLRLHAEAETRGFAVTVDPDLHLMVGGARVDGTRRGGVYTFEIPGPGAGTPASAIWLMSRSGVPAELSVETADTRRLGVAIGRVVADGVGLSDLGGKGWYSPEPGWQWTNGMASLPCAGARRLEVTMALAGRYWRMSGEPSGVLSLARAA